MLLISHGKMKLRVRLGRRTVVCSLDESHGGPTVLSTKEEIRNQFDLANIPFSLSLNSCDLLDEDANKTLSNLGIVSGDLIFVILAGNHVRAERQDDSHDGNADAEMDTVGTGQDNADSPVTDDPSHRKGLTIAVSENPNELLVHDVEAIHDSISNQYLHEPVFIRESTGAAVPQRLRTIMESGDIENSHDAFCAVLHLLMLEAGFCSLPSAGSEERLLTRMPQEWKCPGTYRLGYRHPACEGSSFQLLCVPLGPAIMIHGTVKLSGDVESQTRELSLNVNEFVKENQSDVIEMFSNLPKLSRVFRDGLVYWLLHMGQPDGDVFLIPCLMGLPTELKLMVMRHLDATSLVHVSAVCKEMLVVARERFLWRKLYLRDFGRKTDNNLAQDWLKLYQDKAIERRAIRQMYTEQTLIFTSNPLPGSYPPFHPYIPPYDPFNPFRPVTPMYPPGYIGGEYDLRPNFPAPFGGGGMPLPQPRFDPFSPFPTPRFRPGRGGGLWDTRGRFGPHFM